MAATGDSTTTYHFYVKTGSDGGAGTAARVYVKLYGTKGGDDTETGEHELKGNFESGDSSQIDVTDLVDVGDIKWLRIRHDNTGSRPGWKLNYVTVSAGGKEWDFRAYRWLACDEADENTEAVLAPYTPRR